MKCEKLRGRWGVWCMGYKAVEVSVHANTRIRESATRLYLYCLRTKYDGNVMFSVCLFFWGGGETPVRSWPKGGWVPQSGPGTGYPSPNPGPHSRWTGHPADRICRGR